MLRQLSRVLGSADDLPATKCIYSSGYIFIMYCVWCDDGVAFDAVVRTTSGIRIP